MSSLFEKLGGKPAVNAAVDIFYQKVMEDPKINHFFSDVDMPRQIAKQKVFLTYAFGGAPNYSGKSMREAHKNLDLKEEHFNAVAGHLKSTLEDLEVPDDLQDEVMSIAASTHDDVLNI
jgi:hemoglobin